MTLNEFIEQERTIRTDIHLHNGVWWRTSAFQCCQPVYLLQEVEAGMASPRITQAFVRHSYLVPKGCSGNTSWVCLMLQGSKFSDFSFETLPYEKRKAINKAQKSEFEVRRITSLEKNWEDLREICISTANRTQHGYPASYYVENDNEWRTNMRREYALPKRDWHGVFIGEKMIAFMYSCLVDRTANLLVTKFNSDFLASRPSDYLHYCVISYYRDIPECERVCAGRSVSQVLSIDRFKLGFGFTQEVMPAYCKTNRMVKFGISTLSPLIRMTINKTGSDSRRGILYKLETIEKAFCDGV